MSLHQINCECKKFFSLFSLSLLFIFSLHSQDLNKKQSPSEIRKHNIELMRNVLKKGDYQGYDLIIISSTSQEEANYQQQVLEEAFAETSKKDGKKPIILSVVDSTEGGQLIGGIYTWIKAEEAFRKRYPELIDQNESLLDYIEKNRCTVASFHNGGKGERFSPLTQSLGNSRGSQKLVGSILNAKNEEIELEVLLAVILQCSSFATSNRGTHIDTFWTSQIAFGSHPHDQLVRSNFAIDKFLVGFDKRELIPQNILDFGTAALTKDGRIKAFYGNKRFALRKENHYLVNEEKIEKELLSKGDKVAYDFGSFSASLEMWHFLVDYWKRKQIFDLSKTEIHRAKIKRDIDPHFIQPFIRFLYGINDLADRKKIDEKLPHPLTILTESDLLTAKEQFQQSLKNVSEDAYQYIFEEVNQEKDAKKRDETIACLEEIIEFYLLYRNQGIFSDLKKIFGFIDLGHETQWFRYRRPIDIMNEKIEMLTDLIGKKKEVQLDGSLREFDTEESTLERCYESRMMRGIKENEIAKFKVEGKEITLTLEEVQAGKSIEGVYIKNSIIRHCNLKRGSFIIDSVINDVTGKVISLHSYIESSTSPLIEAKTSVIHEVIDQKEIKADREVVSDVYKSRLPEPYHGRMRAPIGYDPKGMPLYKNSLNLQKEELNDAIKYFIERIPYHLKGVTEYSDKSARTEDGQFTFEEIREIEPHRASDYNFRESIHSLTRETILRGT